jgi:hypothetical protein
MLGGPLSLILRYTCRIILRDDVQKVNDFLLMYRDAWMLENEQRKLGRSHRPDDRPAKGGQLGRSGPRRDSVGFGHGHITYA